MPTATDNIVTNSSNVIEEENRPYANIDMSVELIKNKDFDCKTQYSDEFYKDYISNFKQNPKKKLVYRFIKRSVDLLASLLSLIILSPIFILVAIAIKIDDPKGPVFFKQKRMGKGGRVFNCLKFRSMKTDAPRDCATSVFENPEIFYTRVGRFLRKTSIDELPQLFCCLIGTMSIIGPRPLVLTEEKCNNMRLALGAFRVRPGISGYAQVHGRDSVYYKNKAMLDAEYANRISMLFDLKIIFYSVYVVLFRKGNDTKEKPSQADHSANETNISVG